MELNLHNITLGKAGREVGTDEQRTLQWEKKVSFSPSPSNSSKRRRKSSCLQFWRQKKEEKSAEN